MIDSSVRPLVAMLLANVARLTCQLSKSIIPGRRFVPNSKGVLSGLLFLLRPVSPIKLSIIVLPV